MADGAETELSESEAEIENEPQTSLPKSSTRKCMGAAGYKSTF